MEFRKSSAKKRAPFLIHAAEAGLWGGSEFCRCRQRRDSWETPSAPGFARINV